MKKTTVLVVDDSAFMRKVLSDLFAAEPDFTVVGTARNGQEALEKIRALRPDLVTMDIEMPVMDGLQALETIMRETPVPVIMVSSLTKAGADATIKALEAGAIDFVAKAAPISSVAGIGAELLAKSRIAAKTNVLHLLKQKTAASLPAERKIKDQKSGDPSLPVFIKPPGDSARFVVIGTSTGGPRALQEVIPNLPADLPCGVAVVQHMPPGFTKSLAERLNALSALTVKEAEADEEVRPGVVLIAPGDFHMTLEREGTKTVVKLNKNPPIGGLRPCVDPTMESAAKLYAHQTVGVILTGMGHDGTQGLRAIKRMNGRTVAEDQSTCVVFGMPKSAIEAGVVDTVLPLPAIAGEIARLAGK